MSLETLANELLFDAFEYLSCVDLFHAFNGLNSRFDSLIIEYFRSYKHIDFRLILKEDLNIIRRRYFQLFINEIQSLYLSDDNTTPHQIDLFISRIHPLYRFQNLQSISLFNIYSLDKINRILQDLTKIPTLTDLNFKQCYVQYDPKNIFNMMNSIWSLSNLTNCCLDIYFNDNCHLIAPSVISCSLKHLSISGFQCDLDSFSHLYEYAPYVEYLSLNLWDPYEDHHQLCLLPSITKLKLKCESSSRIIQALLRKMPNLTSLTVETKKILIDGNLWRDIISKYFSKLTTFNLKMEFQLTNNDDVEQEMDRIITSFQNQFWIDQRQWFIRCFCYTENDTSTIHLHTLPYVFDYFSITIGDNFLFKSTFPQDKHCFKYNYVENFEYNRVLSEDINLPYIQFPNVKNLTLTLPCDDHIKFLIPRFNNLVSLNIKMISMNYHDNDLFQIQTLLDQAPTLYYLKFDSWISAASKFESKNKNVIISKKTSNTLSESSKYDAYS